MPRQRFSLLLLLVLSGCGPSVPVKPVDLIGQVSAPAALPVTRPVIAVERADDALVVAIGLLKAGDFRQAEANLEEIVKVRPDLVEAYFNLGWARFQLKKCRDAIPALQEGLKQRPAEIAAVNLIAICQRTLGLFAEAEKTYQQGLLLAPDNDKLHLNIGVLYDLYLFRPDLALEHYRRFQTLQQTPDAKVAGWIALLERMDGK